MGQSRPLKFKLTDYCSPYETIQLLFINQMGGNEFWYFNMDSKRTVQVERNEFRKVLPPQYGTGQRGRTNYSVVAKDQWKINTNWLSEYDYAYLEQLIETTEAFWIKYSTYEAALKPYPIIITNKTYEIKTSLRDRLFLVALEFEMAFDKNVISQ